MPAGTGSYSQLALQMLPKLNFGTGKNVVVINTGHAIQVNPCYTTIKAGTACLILLVWTP